MDRIREIIERVERATKGPWSIRIDKQNAYRNEERWSLEDGSGQSLMCNETYYPWVPDRKEDWEFIASARQDIPFLLNEIERLSEDAEKYRSLCQ